MEISKTFEIEEKLYKEFLDYCSLNEIQNVDDEFIKMFIIGFNISKYGISPFKKGEFTNETKLEIPKKEIAEKETIENVTPIKVNEEVKPQKRVRIIKNKN